MAKEFTEAHLEDMKTLGIDSVTKYAPATEYIPEIVGQVKRLIEKDYAYLIDGEGYYFDLSKFPSYGRLSGRTMTGAEDATSRIDESSKKKNRGDFALWKFSSETELGWDSEIGYGRPGWHIEDTAISEKYFGQQYDIHGGARDLIFPHHEAEIAQMESISGLQPFVKYWLHTGFVSVDGQKMSKSLGNFSTIRQVLEKYSPEVVRFAMLQSHYRSPVDFNYQLLDSAKTGLKNLLELKYYLDLIKEKNNFTNTNDSEISKFKDQILASLDDDFNTPEAFGLINSFASQVFARIHDKSLDRKIADTAYEILDLLKQVFGIIPKNHFFPDNIKKILADYDQARQTKDYTSSDQIRNKLKDLGYEVEDTVYGPLVKITI